MCYGNSDFYAYFGIPRPAGTLPVPTWTLYKGLSGDDVKWLQDKLNGYGHKLAVDGSFGAKTDTALSDFQKNNGLTVDGRCGPATRAKLG